MTPNPRPELPREFVAGHKRRRMIDAIVELTAERGYEATKIADIVRVAGVARKTLYDNFDGKEDLFLAAVDSALAQARSEVEAACEATEGDWREKLESGIDALLGFIAENPEAARTSLVEAQSAIPAAAARYNEAVRGFVDLLRRATPPDSNRPPTIEETLIGGVAWILNREIRNGDAPAATELGPELTQFVLSPYCGVVKSGVAAGGESNSTVPESHA